MNKKIIKKIDWDLVRNEIINSSNESAIYIGCDSRLTKKSTYFALAVIIHLDGCHGGRIFTETCHTDRITSLRHRLLKEVEIVVDGAMKIEDVIEDRLFQIHLDINPDVQHKSNIVVKEALGWVQGLGYDCHIKPNSWAASHCADHIIQD